MLIVSQHTMSERSAIRLMIDLVQSVVQTSDDQKAIELLIDSDDMCGFFLFK